MTFEDIEKAFDEFMEFPEWSIKSVVTSVSAKLFAKYCIEKQQARIDELEEKVEWLQSVINNGMLPQGYEIKQKEQDNE